MAAQTSGNSSGSPAGRAGESAATARGPGRVWPDWLAVPAASVSDLLVLAGVRFALDLARHDAGVIETLGWLLGTKPGPGTGRRDRPWSRAVAWCEMAATAQHALEGTGRPAPELRRVCAELGVTYVPPRSGDPEFGLGAYRTLRWALGETHEEPMRLPLRGHDGQLLGITEILPEVLSTGIDPEAARAQALDMAADTRRLAALVSRNRADRR